MQTNSELTLRSIILAILLTLILAVSNTYLALKLGILTSASIPAAILSMGILRFFKNPTILENNAVQTAASAGEAIAGGVVYTLPALIIIQYWQQFDYLSTFVIALSGGVLGILFSIPLRHILVHDPKLSFPEGRAVAEILKFSSKRMNGMRDIITGSIISGIFEFLQMGLQLIASNWNFGFFIKKSLFGFGFGFSSVMIGAGYLIGYEIAISICLGSIISWLVIMPITSNFYPELLQHLSINQDITTLWSTKMRYFGIGAMLFSGIWVFINLVRPLVKNILSSIGNIIYKYDTIVVHERDLPMPLIAFGILLMSAVLFYAFNCIFPLQDLYPTHIIIYIIIYILIMGFLFAIITAYFSGMIGVTASPGSSIVIAGILLTAWLIMFLLKHQVSTNLMASSEALTIIIGAILTGIAAIANDNIQDLKVGQLLKATPWKQQLMLLLGVLVASAIIPLIMQLLFNVYGIAGISATNNELVNSNQSLPAPTAALMAAITQAVFQHSIPWLMMFYGALTIIVLLLINRFLHFKKLMKLSILGVAIGMYLPTSSSFPLFLGGIMAMLINSNLKNKIFNSEISLERKQSGVLIACGLVTGSALIDVCLAIPFSLLHSVNVLSIATNKWHEYSIILAIISLIVFFVWLNHKICNTKNLIKVQQ